MNTKIRRSRKVDHRYLVENVLLDEDIIFVTTGKYKLFLKHGRVGMDAYILYSHYMFTCRMQQTNSIWATDTYIRNGLNFTRPRLQKAKNLLLELGLISTRRERDAHGKLGKTFVTVKTKTSPSEFSHVHENQHMENVQQMLKQPTKCLNKQLKINFKINAAFARKLANDSAHEPLTRNIEIIESVMDKEPFTVEKKKRLGWEIVKCLVEFFNVKHLHHPIYKQENWKTVIGQFDKWGVESEMYDEFLENVETDGHLLHFATDGILEIRTARAM